MASEDLNPFELAMIAEGHNGHTSFYYNNRSLKLSDDVRTLIRKLSTLKAPSSYDLSGLDICLGNLKTNYEEQVKMMRMIESHMQMLR